MKPLKPADFDDIPTDSPTLFDCLTNSDNDTLNVDLPSARRWARYCRDPVCHKYLTAWPCKSNFWLHLYGTAVHCEDVRTYAKAGRRKLAREWRVDTEWEMNEPRLPRPTPEQNGTHGIAPENE
ncbi:uncharacterized protein PV09_09698 [Verruconis gallopava]|uniref:Uncharacterized protein n=1 Tax=Verruconis gallopava TaxID=253628 RepID=A0A0D1YCW1_9PEZI|nr:uncharacterized protein PV09_09698 [Verruconis gallopava]KIV98496.1 hypothetical protein PV09_09698 [Verruconis gallopava]